MKFIEQNPHPSSLLFAIRAIGYNFETAVADIIDNSISAGATEIKMYSEPSGNAYFAFLDNGCGMSNEELRNALLLGSDRAHKPDSELELGRYGLGLKSASFSQCRRFYVVSKKDSLVSAMTFGLDDVEASGKWRTGLLTKSEYTGLPEVSRLLNQDRGTLVIWQDFDKLNKNTSNFEVSFRRAVDHEKKHVEYVFHRFYAEIAIFFNEDRVEERDPFLMQSYGMQQEGRGLETMLDGHKIRIAPFSLPYANSLNDSQRRLLGNPKSIYDEQGLYLYRNRRLIAWGSWFRTEVRSELNKLARVRVDIPSALDDIWMLDVKKSSAKIPDKLKDKIRIAISDSVFRSRGAVKKPSEKEALAEHRVWERTLRDQTSVEYRINRNNPLYVSLRSALPSKELGLFEQFVEELEDFIPKFQIHVDQAGDKKIVNGISSSLDESARVAKLVGKICDAADPDDREYLLDKYLAFETYMDLRPRRAAILKEVRNHV